MTVGVRHGKHKRQNTMFSVYGMSGQLFRGSLEQLRQVGGVAALTRSRAVPAQGQDSGGEAAGAFGQALAEASATDDDARRAVLSAYAPASAPRQPLRTVRTLMTAKAITLPDSATVQQAWQVLADNAVGQVPVVDAAGHLVGLLLRADLLKTARLLAPPAPALAWPDLLQQRVADVMVTPVPGVVADADIRRVARVLLDTGLPGLPVLDEPGAVIGFISRSDILRAVVTDPPLDLWG